MVQDFFIFSIYSFIRTSYTQHFALSGKAVSENKIIWSLNAKTHGRADGRRSWVNCNLPTQENENRTAFIFSQNNINRITIIWSGRERLDVMPSDLGKATCIQTNHRVTD